MSSAEKSSSSSESGVRGILSFHSIPRSPTTIKRKEWEEKRGLRVGRRDADGVHNGFEGDRPLIAGLYASCIATPLARALHSLPPLTLTKTCNSLLMQAVRVPVQHGGKKRAQGISIIHVIIGRHLCSLGHSHHMLQYTEN